MNKETPASIARARTLTAAEEYRHRTLSRGVMLVRMLLYGDVRGNRILECSTAASGALLLGNRHPLVVEAITKVHRRLRDACSPVALAARIELAPSRLCEALPGRRQGVFWKSRLEAPSPPSGCPCRHRPRPDPDLRGTTAGTTGSGPTLIRWLPTPGPGWPVFGYIDLGA